MKNTTINNKQIRNYFFVFAFIIIVAIATSFGE